MHRIVAIAIAAAALIGLGSTNAQADRRWVTYDEPPAPRHTEYRARTGYVWIEGHWALYDDGWRWIEGHYERTRSNRVYVRGGWVLDDGAYRWRNGRWSDRKKSNRYRDDDRRERKRWRDRDRDDDRRDRRRNRRGRR